MNNYGYQNERDFVMLFNNKFLFELDINSQKFLNVLFNSLIDNDEKIRCWKNNMTQKADIFIKYKKYVKGISIKCGNSNSVHSEQVQDFRRYLEKLNIPYSVIDKYFSYHYGYRKDDNGHNDYSRSLSSYEYKELYQSEIDIFNDSINKTKIIIDMVDRFLIRGKNSEHDIDALICGKTDDYVWILKYDLYDLVLSKNDVNYSSPHISCMTIGPKKRNLNGSCNNIKDKYLISVRWHNLYDDIVNFYNKR